MYNVNEIRDTIICGNTLDVLKQFPNECIDTVCCSPPYWGLRDYGIEGQLGLEPTFQLYIENLQTIFDEVWRVLKREGTLWCNMGDTYGSGNGQLNKTLKTSKEYFQSIGRNSGWHNKKVDEKALNYGRKGVKGYEKCLLNIPHRFAISMTDNGWVERNCIIWHKPSCMPSSAKDRFTVDYEFVFMFSKNRKYYFEQQLEPYADITLLQKGQDYRGKDTKNYEGVVPNNTPYHPGDIKRRVIKALDENKGRNKRCVWKINPQSFKDAHFAVFPEKLVEPMIKAGCPSQICDNCNKPYLSDYQTKKGDVVETYTGEATKDYKGAMAQNPSDTKRRVLESMRTTKTHIGYKPACDCNPRPPTHAGIVLDPFCGSGTTCLVARKLQMHYIGIDLQPDYVKMSEKRLAEML